MTKFLRQTSDPDVEAGLEATRPFFWILILVLVFLYGITVYSSPELRQLSRLLPYTALFFIHIALHWYMPYLVAQKQRLAIYLVVQIFLAFVLILIGKQTGLVIGLYTTLAGETIGILENWRRSLVAIAGYLIIMGVTYGMIWGWDMVPGWLGPALILMLFVMVYVILFLRQLDAREESQRLLAELQDAHRQLAEYAQQVETLTLEAERQRMARELHDTLAQGLAGLVLQLEALEASLERGNQAKAAQIAGQAKERARTALGDARRAIDDLRASDVSATEAISREVERFTTATGIHCALDMPSELTVSEQNGEHAVRCVSEGLANVARHAQASQAWVTISEAGGWLTIQIRDNGRGFEANERAASGHYGLLGLQERTRLAQGEMTVESEPGMGTTLHMTLPTETNGGNQTIENGEAA